MSSAFSQSGLARSGHFETDKTQNSALPWLHVRCNIFLGIYSSLSREELNCLNDSVNFFFFWTRITMVGREMGVPETCTSILNV